MSENKETAEAQGITNEKLQEITGKLKLCCPGWATVVADKMSEAKEWKDWSNNPCSPENVRLLSKGIIKGQRHRLLFAKVAAKIIIEMAQEQKETQKLINQI